MLHAGDERTIPAFTLTVGSEATTVTVKAASEMIPTEDGARTNVLDFQSRLRTWFWLAATRRSC